MKDNSCIKEQEIKNENENLNSEESKENVSLVKNFESKGKVITKTPMNPEKQKNVLPNKDNKEQSGNNMINSCKIEKYEDYSQNNIDDNNNNFITPERLDNPENIQNKNNNENNNNERRKKYNKCIIYIFGFIILIIAIIIGAIYINNLNKEEFIILDDEESETFEEDDDILEINNKKYEAIISIDFGSSYSGFAIAYRENAIESKIENIQPTTIIILKNNLKGYRYGKDAENFMNEQRSEDYIYFDRIKTKLDPKFKNDIQSKIYIDSKFPSNYKINLRIIIKEYLRLFSDDALKYYNLKGNTKYSKDDIKWIVTVPAIWNEYGK